MTLLEASLLVVLIALLTPPVVYVACKLGAYAVLRGRQIFESEKENESHGEQK
jgi:hypothetical protein